MPSRDWKPVGIASPVANLARKADLSAMFLETLEAGEEPRFLGLEDAFVHAAGVLAELAAWILARLSNAIGEPELERTVDKLVATFHTQRSEVSELLGLTCIRYVDGDQHGAEIESGAETTMA